MAVAVDDRAAVGRGVGIGGVVELPEGIGAFDQWAAMGAVELTERAELETLAARSVPAINKYSVSAEDGVLRLDAMLDMLELRLIVISPK